MIVSSLRSGRVDAESLICFIGRVASVWRGAAILVPNEVAIAVNDAVH